MFYKTIAYNFAFHSCKNPLLEITPLLGLVVSKKLNPKLDLFWLDSKYFIDLAAFHYLIKKFAITIFVFLKDIVFLFLPLKCLQKHLKKREILAFKINTVPEWLIILNTKAHPIWPKSAQKGAQYFFPKKSHIFGKRRTIFNPPNNFYCIFIHKCFGDAKF